MIPANLLMDRTSGLLLILGMAAALFAVSRDADAGFAPSGGGGGGAGDAGDVGDTEGSTSGGGAPVDVETLMAAFLSTIRQFESRGRYDVIYGFRPFGSYAHHPDVKVWFHDPTRAGEGNNNYTTAAGAYQFITTTWAGLKSRLGLPDFSPASQDAAAYQLLVQLGVRDKLAAGDIAGAFARAAGTWASLPGSLAQQNPQSLAVALDTFNRYAGVT